MKNITKIKSVSKSHFLPAVFIFCQFFIFPVFSATIDKGHNLGQLRGAMVGTDVTEEDILEFGKQWQANHIRWQLNWEDASSNNSANDYWTWLYSELDNLDKILEYCRNAGIKVLIDLHTTPGGRVSNNVNRIFTDQEALDVFYEVWRTIASRYKDNTVVWGYDLVNEPVEKSSGQVDSWHDIATRAAQIIRTIDSKHSIIVEVPNYSLPSGFDGFSAIDVERVVYSVHVYNPHRFTHQGLSDFGSTGVSYPGFIDGEYWNKARIIESLQPVISFQNKYAVPIYVGEFSAIRWAPGDSAYNFISDVIDVFESYGWDWSYHAFREWDGWSVEYPSGTTSTTPASSTTKRETLLKSWYAKNNKPNYFFSLYPDNNTRFYYSQNNILACSLPALYDDQGSSEKITVDVNWLMDSATAVFSVSNATLPSASCGSSLNQSPASSGFIVNFASNNANFSDPEVLRTCDFNLQYLDAQGNIQFNDNIDLDWYFKAEDATWRFYNLQYPIQENCLSKTVITPPD